MDTQKLQQKIEASKAYWQWKKKHDAFEQIAIIKSWCDYEDYDVSDLCHNDAREVIALYLYLHFVLDIEFLSTAQGMADDEHFDDYDKVDVKNAQLLINELNKKR